MTDPLKPRSGTRLAYAISACTTLLWFACVLPAGRLQDAATLSEDIATPMHRSAWLLVPALFVLVIGPVGIILSHGRAGRIAVLAATDAFLSGYAGIALVGRIDIGEIAHRLRVGTIHTWMLVEAGLVALMFLLAVLSTMELVRVLRRGPRHHVPPLLRGARLAICLFVLVIPSWVLFTNDRVLGPMLLPFVFVGAGAAGPAFARAPLGLRLTASVVHALLALFVILVLHATLFEQPPAFAYIDPIGLATLGLAVVLALLATLQVGRIALKQRQVRARAANMPATVG